MAERRSDVDPDLGLVALQGGRADPAHRDRREPVVEPPANRDSAGAGFEDDARVSLVLESPHLGDDVGALGAGDVASVASAVLLPAHGDEAVPPAVLVLVDRRLTTDALARHRRPPTPRSRAVSFLGVRHGSLPASLVLDRRRVSRGAPTPGIRNARSGVLHRVRGKFKQAVLVRGSSPVSARSSSDIRLGRLKPVDVALELGAGDPAAAADVHRMQVAGLHECVDRGSADAEHRGGLFGCEQQRVTGRQVPGSLRVVHLALLLGVRSRAPEFGAARLLEKASFSADW
jgi:hypothetical protein